MIHYDGRGTDGTGGAAVAAAVSSSDCIMYLLWFRVHGDCSWRLRRDKKFPMFFKCVLHSTWLFSIAL